MVSTVPAAGYYDINGGYKDNVGGPQDSHCTESFREVIYPAFKILGSRHNQGTETHLWLIASGLL